MYWLLEPGLMPISGRAKQVYFLEEGSVDLILTATGETVSLSPDELGSLEDGKIRKIYGKKSQLIGWKERKLFLRIPALKKLPGQWKRFME